MHKSLAVPVCVLYMDRGDSESSAVHLFPDDATNPVLYLLYRPGHYDVLYKAEEVVLPLHDTAVQPAQEHAESALGTKS